MRILHALRRIEPRGGIESYVRELLPLLARRGHTNLVIHREGRAERLAEGTEAYRLEPGAEHELDALVARVRPDVVLAQDVYDPELLARLAARLPTVSYVQIFYPVCPGLGKLFRRGDHICTRPYGLGCVPNIYLRRCASARRPSNVARIMATTRRHLALHRGLPGILVASGYMRELLIQNGIDGERVRVLPLPISAAAIAGPGSGEPDPATLLFAGRLEHEKGLGHLLEALARLAPPARLVVAGDGTRGERWRRLASRLGVADRVEWRGWLEDGALTQAYRQAAVVAMPSLMPEPFGKSGLDALGLARPVVAFDVGGIREWLDHGRSGYLVPPLDTAALAARIAELLADPARARAMGRHGRERALERFAPEPHADALAAVLADAAAEPRPWS